MFFCVWQVESNAETDYHTDINKKIIMFDRVTDSTAQKLLFKCRPYLVHLNLRGCEQITANTFFSIRECRNLQDLNLSECPAVNVSKNVPYYPL